MNNPEISRWIFVSKQGDRNAYENLVKYAQNIVYGYAFRFLTHDKEARQVVVNTFVRIWSQIPIYDQTFNFDTWVYKIASYVGLKEIHDSARAMSIRIPTNEPKKQLEGANAVLGENLRELTAEMEAPIRNIFVLRYLQKLEIREISVITGLSIEHIKILMENIREVINVHHGEESENIMTDEEMMKFMASYREVCPVLDNPSELTAEIMSHIHEHKHLKHEEVKTIWDSMEEFLHKVFRR